MEENSTLNEYGKHSELVKEVLRFVKDGQVLSKPFDVKLTNAFDVRMITSMDGIDRFRDPDWPDSEICDSVWFDIKRIDEGLLHNAASNEFTETIWPIVEANRRNTWNELESHLKNVLPTYEIEEILGDFDYLMLLRAAAGKTKSFSEQLYCIYQAGGYPCGWSGSYPEGELVVFSRQ